jgi:tetratricopeptide (TPR) repeat protein
MDSFENAYREIGNVLEVEGMHTEDADVKSLVQMALGRSDFEWLLILDNADDAVICYPDRGRGLVDYLPSNRRGSILMTTRDHSIASRFQFQQRHVVQLHGMGAEEAKELLVQGLKPQQRNDTATASLLELLSYLPLAIRQASAYMARTGMAVDKYLNHCRDSDQKFIRLLSEDFEDLGRYRETENPVALTWLISFDQIQQQCPTAVEFMKLVSFIAARDVPRSFLHRASRGLLSSPEEDDLKEDEAFGVLEGYAFITPRDYESFDVHRLVQLAMRNWVNAKRERDACVIRVMTRLAEEVGDPQHDNKQMWMRWLPHMQASVQYGDDHTSLYRLELMVVIGGCYNLLAKFNEAEGIYREILVLRAKMEGKDSPEALSNMNNLALVLSSQGKLDEAEAIHREMMDLIENLVGLDDIPVVLTGINNLALVLKWQGKYAEAEKLYQKMLALEAERHTEAGIIGMNNMAALMSSQGRISEAEELYREALKIGEHVFSEIHLAKLSCKNNLALALSARGHYKNAERLYGEILSLSEEMLGKENPFIITTMNNLAHTHSKQGRYGSAEAIHRDMLELCISALGKESPDTLSSMNHLVCALVNQGKDVEAEKVCREALTLRKRVLGETEAPSLASMNNLAVLLKRQGKFEEAESIHRKELFLCQSTIGVDNPETLISMNNLACTLQSQGKLGEAEDMYRETLALSDKVLGRDHPDTLGYMNNLAVLLSTRERYAEAEELQREALALMDKVVGRESPDALASLGNLAVLLERKGKHEEAQELYREVGELSAKTMSGKGHAGESLADVPESACHMGGSDSITR